jgi:lyso-ornithine lipid O-acyltransferase
MMLRRCRRAVALAIALLMCMVRLGLRRLRVRLAPHDRALWLQEACRGVLASLGISVRVEGTAPGSGLVVSNHLTYMDIAVCASVMPCAFVSKKEVSRWPFFGLAARSAGTLFIDRASRASADAVALEMAGRLHQPIPILLFPEGTSSDGTRVLRFHTGLFEPAVTAAAPITAAAIRYLSDGDVPERDVCWFGDEAFLPHLWRTLGVRGLRAELAFGEPRIYPDRRTAARETQAEVEGMRANVSGIAPKTSREAVTAS